MLDTVCLQDDRDHHESYAYPEGYAHFACLSKQYCCEDYAVDGLQVICDIDSECGQAAQCMDLETERNDGEDRSENQQTEQILAVGDDSFRVRGGIERHAEGKYDGPSDELIEQDAGSVFPRGLRHIDVQDGED